MPKPVQRYQCVFCRQEYKSHESCFSHEAAHHLGLMPEILREWCAVYVSNPGDDEKLKEFEKENGIPTSQEHETLKHYAKMCGL